MTYLSYKGYKGTIEPQIETGTLYGKLAFIRDLVTYEANTVSDLEAEFRASVDDYLEDCAELGKTPDKPFKGSLNIRIGEELHRRIATADNNLHQCFYLFCNQGETGTGLWARQNHEGKQRIANTSPVPTLPRGHHN